MILHHSLSVLQFSPLLRCLRLNRECMDRSTLISVHLLLERIVDESVSFNHTHLIELFTDNSHSKVSLMVFVVLHRGVASMLMTIILDIQVGWAKLFSQGNLDSLVNWTSFVLSGDHGTVDDFEEFSLFIDLKEVSAQYFHIL